MATLRLPKCATQCRTDSALNNCGPADVDCLCRSRVWLEERACCELENCNSKDVQSAQYFYQKICQQYDGATWPKCSRAVTLFEQGAIGDSTEPYFKLYLRQAGGTVIASNTVVGGIVGGGGSATPPPVSVTTSTTFTTSPSATTTLSSSEPGSTSATANTDSSGSTSSSSSGSSTNVGAIAGGVVGGVVGLALIAGAIFMLFRRKQKQKTSTLAEVQRYPASEK